MVRALVLAVVVAGLAACSSAPTFDRAAAVDRFLARQGSGVSRGQAECYVDRVTSEVGSAALETDDPDPEKVARLTRIRIDCVGLASLGTAAPAPLGTATSGGGTGITVPLGPGDDPQLDVLHAACGAGNGTACDQLFDLAALGSAYEEFASTCGGRTREIRCAPRYPGPSIALSTTSSVPTGAGGSVP